MLPPGLNRAISDSTSPFGAYPSAEVLRNLEVYLADTRSTDAVYGGLVNRACAEPLSVPLVEKVVALLKAYLLRYTPSQDVVQLLEEFSFRAQDVAGLSVTGRKAVQYVRSCLRQLRGDRPSGIRSSRGSYGSMGNGLRGSWGRSREDLTRLGPDGRAAPIKVSVGSSALGRANARYAAVDALASPSDADAGGGRGRGGLLPAWLRQWDGKGGRGWDDLRVPSAQEAALGAEPLWAVPMRPLQLPPPPLGATAGRARSWMQHLPELAPRVTLAPYPAAAEVGPSSLGAVRASSGVPYASLTLSGAPPISLATIHRCILDLDEQDIGRHLAEVLGEARVEAQQMQPPTPQQRQHPSRAGGRGGGPGGAGGNGRDALGGRRSRPARLLFHHPPYNRAEQLPMTETDVVVVVEAVCGVRAASALAAIQGPSAASEEEAAAPAAGQAEGMWQAAFEEDGDFGQMCGSILMKLIVDLWTRCGPVGSYMLVLRMLRAALRSGQPSTRARAFDVVYNLSLHGAMLRSDAEEAALGAAAVEMGNGAGGVGGMQMPWQVCASAPVSPFISGGGGLTPPPAPRPSTTAVTPVASIAATQTPTAMPAGGGNVTPVHHVASHSLGLPGSGLLDSAGSLTGMASGYQGGRHTARNTAGAADGVNMFPRKDAPDSVRPPAPPPSPSASPGVKAAALGGAATGATGATGSASGYDRWLRALLFQLLCDLCEGAEYTEEVWRAAMGCTSQVCSHGGHWVAAWVQHLPPVALSGLLRAACNLSWSQELYAHLLKLVPYVLVRGAAAAQQPGAAPVAKRPDSAFAAPTALGSATAAAADDAAAAAATTTAAEAAEMSQRLAAFGGLEEILFHFMRAPTPDARASLLTALVHCSSGFGGSGPVSLASSGERMSENRSPRTSGSPSRMMDVGPSSVLAVLQGLHLDSVCLALRAALQRPWPGMSSRLADVLASASTAQEMANLAFNGSLPSPSASVSGSADYAPSTTLPAGGASPIAVRVLLRPLLDAVEFCCADSMLSPQGGELRTHMDTSVNHILGGAASGPVTPPPLTAKSVTAAWRCFKEVCSEESAEARQLSIHWLHKLLSSACRACLGQILLLSPLSLKTSPEASKIAAAAAVATSPQLPQWNTALADALLHVVREAPLGCELLMAAISRVAADQKATAGSPDLPLSPRFAGMVAPHAAAAVTGEEAALVACRRVMWLYYVGLQWMLQCGSAEARMPAVVDLADIVLTALLQPDPAVAAAQAALGAGIATAAAAAAAGDKALPASAGGARGSSQSLLASAGRGGGGSILSPQPTQVAPHAGGAAGPPAAAAGQPHLVLQEPGGGMLISQQLLAGLLALDPDALACTPPELLVTLLQQCSQSLQDAGARATTASNGGAKDSAEGIARGSSSGAEGGFRSMHRGFLGRPCAVVGGSAMPAAAASSGGGRAGVASGSRSATSEATLSGAAVGPWQDDWQDRRLALLLLLMARCSLDPEAFAKYSLSHVIKAQLGCEDLRCRYYAGVYLLKHWMLNQHDKYWRTLRHIIGTAQQLNDERLLDNPYLQMRTMLNVDHA